MEEIVLAGVCGRNNIFNYGLILAPMYHINLYALYFNLHISFTPWLTMSLPVGIQRMKDWLEPNRDSLSRSAFLCQ